MCYGSGCSRLAGRERIETHSPSVRAIPRSCCSRLAGRERIETSTVRTLSTPSKRCSRLAGRERIETRHFAPVVVECVKLLPARGPGED